MAKEIILIIFSFFLGLTLSFLVWIKEISFGSAPHGAGRLMSRAEAKRKVKGSELKKELEKRGISVAAGSMSGLAEEAPVAYKDVSEVVEVVHNIGIAKKLVKLVPIGVIKG
jgi:tRNA-splicing ligase RtcB